MAEMAEKQLSEKRSRYFSDKARDAKRGKNKTLLNAASMHRYSVKNPSERFIHVLRLKDTCSAVLLIAN